MSQTTVEPRCMGYPVTLAGELRDSSDAIDHVDELRRRMSEEGYLYLPGLLDRDEVLAARAEVCRRLADAGYLDGREPAMEAIVAEAAKRPPGMDVMSRGNRELARVLYDGAMMRFWRSFLGGEVRHFDYTWFRTVFPGTGTASHCDIVYMGRGTPNLYTAWTPIGDIDTELGGLMVLEGSNNHGRLRETYCRIDVDEYCANRGDPAGIDSWHKRTGGWLAKNPAQIQRSLGGRWLSRPVYRAGDVVVFSVFTVHAGMDNQTANRIRLSSDSRYQLASQPADERWIGENPVGHGPGGKRGVIC